MKDKSDNTKMKGLNEMDMKLFKDLYTKLVSKKISIDDLDNYRQEFINGYSIIKKDYKNIGVKDVIEPYLRLCLDYYTYSDMGDNLILDTQYDEIMSIYVKARGEYIIYADPIGSDSSKWDFVKHDVPGLVGSIRKTYSFEEIEKYYRKMGGIEDWIIAPKYDGGSAAVLVQDGRVVKAATRYDGVTGQDITELIRHSRNADSFHTYGDGWYKCELVVLSNDFQEMVDRGCTYKNRRSATTALINTPKNLKFAEHLTVVPLLYYNEKTRKIKYTPPKYRKIKARTAEKLFEEVEELLLEIRKPDFPIRVDGVVIYPLDELLHLNMADFMDIAIAYKVNSAEGVTQIRYGYMSVGRLGNAVPMVKVKPVEVNETTVEDVSLCSYDKYAQMDLHEGETIIVYSAGDVIPQAKIPSHREYPAGAGYLKIKKECPHCGEKLERVQNIYKCTNDECPGRIVGKIANFVIKLGAANVSDATIADLYENKIIRNIKDLFELKYKEAEISNLPNYGEKKARNIIESIQTMINKEITVSELFGALGIPDISEKKCRKIFEVISLKYALNKSKHKIIDKVLNGEGIGMRTAETFAEFVTDNSGIINFLVDHMNIVERNYIGTVVFTNFRDDGWVEKFRSIGYDVTNNVTNSTTAVVSGTIDHDSGNCRKAIAKGIPIWDKEDINRLYLKLSKN